MTTPLSELTTMQVGGRAAELLEAHSRDQLVEFATGVWASGEEWLILGGGSNIVAADDLSHLTVIRTLNRGIERNGNLLRVQAGENWDEFVKFTVDAGLSGVEALSGIPGCVGAAPVQNIGAYGQEVADTIVRLEFVEYPSGNIRIMTADELEFGYRDSVFKRGMLGVITWVEFELSDSGPARLERLTEALGREVTSAAEIRAEVLATRAKKGMVLDPTDRDTVSCGSFFTNPIVSDGFSRSIPGEAPRWLQPDGSVKLSAAWLIENSGLSKGFRLGQSGAALSTKHALAITNRGDATAEQVRELASFIQLQVANRWGVNLVPEPNFVGF